MHIHAFIQRRPEAMSSRSKVRQVSTFGYHFDTILSPFRRNIGHRFDHHNGCSLQLCKHVRLRLFCPNVWSGGAVYLAFLELV